MTKEQLNELSIYALRNMARKTGVEAPTSKRKEQLINEILLILEGKLSPHIAKNRQGRPPKNTGLPFTETFNYGFNHNDFSNYLSFNQMQSEFVYDDLTTMLGYVDLKSNGTTGVIIKDNDKYLRYLLPTSLIERYNLITGDLVLVEISENGVVQTVYEINGTLAKNFKPSERKDFANIKHVSVKRELLFKNDKFNKLNLKKGENIYLYGNDNSNLTRICIDLLNTSNEKKKIYINLSLTDKNKTLINELAPQIEKFTTFVIDDQKFAQFMISLATDRARRLIENGDDVLIVIDDLKTVNALDMDDKNLTKNLITLSKDAVENGSITIIAVMDKTPSLDVYEKLADVRVKLENNSLII